MRDACGDEDDGAGLDVPDLVTDGDPAAAADDVVDLVLGVRLLEVRLAGREDVQPDAQVGDRDELEVGPAGRRAAGVDVGELVGIHRRSVAAAGNRRSGCRRTMNSDDPPSLHALASRWSPSWPSGARPRKRSASPRRPTHGRSDVRRLVARALGAGCQPASAVWPSGQRLRSTRRA